MDISEIFPTFAADIQKLHQNEAKDIAHPKMNIHDFTHTFLPQLLRDYTQEKAELHALVDFELWKRIMPDTPGEQADGHFLWYQIRLNAFELQDQTLLLTYTLPVPISKGQPKFVGIRLDRAQRQAHYYLLLKPQDVEDLWDIHWMPFPKASEKMKLEFMRKIDGTDSLRNFVLTVQQKPFTDSDYDTSFISSILRIFKDTVAPME